MTTSGMQGEVSPESTGKIHLQPSEARPTRNPPLPQLLGSTAEQGRLKPCAGKPFDLSNKLEFESQNGNPGLSLEDAHWRLSALPAMCAGFRERGTLRIGAPADVVVYDYQRLQSRPMEIAHDFPGGEWRRIQRADGYMCVLVNGAVTLRSGVGTGTCSGKLLRHGM